jgi:eukaryotic-like serine/threonine-protein kinase
VAQRYRLERLAGQGGMGAVFRARDEMSGDVVAIKLSFGREHEVAKRLVTEADILSGLDDPRIVRYVGHGRDEGYGFLALEWLEGEDLDRRLGRESPSVAEALEVVDAVAHALERLHAERVVHADLKPANLFLVGKSVTRTKLIDFGTAHRPEAGETPGAMGTPHYLSPEQAAGSKLLDARTDIYGLGCVLYECLAGRVPFDGTTLFELLRSVLTDPPTPPSSLRDDVPPAVEQLCLAMLQKDPDHRPPSAEAVLTWIAAIRGETAVPTSRPSLMPRRTRTLMGDERRLVSVLVLRPILDGAPMASTVPLTEALGALDGRVLEVAAAHGARAESIGGASFVIMADAGNAPEARLARCGLALAELAPDASLGLATGLASVTGLWPLGEAIDSATVLAAHPQTGVRLDATTHSLLDERFEVDPSEHAFLLRAYHPNLASADESDGRLFGRADELSRVAGPLSAARHAGQAGAAIIVGAAGSGKSRLLREVLRQPFAAGATVCMGYGDALAPGAPYAVLKSALRRVLGLGERDGAPVRRLALDRRLAALPMPPGSEPAATFVGALLELAPSRLTPPDVAVRWASARRDPLVMADEIRRAVTQWIEGEIAGCGAALFVVEDLQWADPPSLQIVAHALTVLADRALLVLGTLRDDGREDARTSIRNASPWPGAECVELAGLGPEAAAALVRAHLGQEADEELVTRVVLRAEGNPFFLAELARVATGGQITSPDTVLTIAQRHLDRLSGDARRVLRAASVFGNHFWPQALVALVGPRVAGQLEDLFEELVAADIVERRPGLDLGGEPAWGFRHALLRDAAYSSLAALDRPIAHRLAAGWLEARRVDDPMALAEHWRASDAEVEAAPYYLRVAQRALAGFDHKGALAAVDRGIEVGAGGTLKAELLLTAAEAQEWHGGSMQQRAAAAAAVQALVEPGSPAWYRAFFHMLDARNKLDGTATLAELIGHLLALPASPVPSDDEVIALVRVAILCLRSGDAAKSAEVERHARERAGRVGAPSAKVRGFFCWLDAWKALAAGDVLGAYQGDSAAVAAFAEASEVRLLCTARSDVGYEQMRLGLLEESQRSYEQAIETAERLGLRLTAAIALHNLGLVYGQLGRIDDALATEQRAIDELALLDSARHQAASYDYLARVYMMAGRPEEAEQAARDEVRLAERWPELALLARASLGRALLALGRVGEALEETRAAMAACDPDGSADGEQIYVASARLDTLIAAGRLEEARQLHAWAHAALEKQSAALGDLREAFLTRVPENAAILRVGQQLATL